MNGRYVGKSTGKIIAILYSILIRKGWAIEQGIITPPLFLYELNYNFCTEINSIFEHRSTQLSN